MDKDQQQPQIDWSTRSTPEGLDAICRYYYPWSQQLAELAIKRVPVQCDHNHLRSAAGLALLEAVRNFDPTKGFKFRSFATMRIRGAIIDAMRENDHLSRQSRSWVTQRMKAEADLLSELCRPPQPEEVCERLGWNREQYFVSLGGVLNSLHSTKFADSDGDWSDDILATTKPLSLERQANFDELMRGFTIEERTIIYLYYYRHSPMKVIALALGISESRVSQMHKQICEHLKQMPERFREKTG